MTNSRFFAIGGIICFSLIILFFIFVVPNIPANSCQQKERSARRLLISRGGLVVKKFNDAPNHNYETIRYVDSQGQKESTDFVFEESGCYNFLEIGDSIFKDEGSLILRVKRNGKDTLFNMSYGCK